MIDFGITNDFKDVPEIVNLLEQLTPTDKNYDKALLNATANYIFFSPSYTVFVAKDDAKIIGMAMLRVDYKFAHKGTPSAHIEDVVVDFGYRGSGIGSVLVTKAINKAIEIGVYKVTLNCFEHNVPFYEKLGFHKHDNGMRLDL